MAEGGEHKPDDDELVASARAGSSAAFDALVRRHQRAVLRWAWRELNNAADAEDIAQATFLEVHRSLARYRPQGQFAGWLYVICHHQCLMFIRSSRARRSRELRASDDAPPEMLTPVDDADLAATVNSAVASLTDARRFVVLMHYMLEKPIAEIADTLDLKPATVKTRLFEARRQLSTLLGKKAP